MAFPHAVPGEARSVLPLGQALPTQQTHALFKSTDLGDGAEEEAMFKRSDLGLRFGVNVTFRKHYNVSLGYDLGLLNILKDADEVKAKNGSFFVSLGYNF